MLFCFKLCATPKATIIVRYEKARKNKQFVKLELKKVLSMEYLTKKQLVMLKYFWGEGLLVALNLTDPNSPFTISV